MISRIGQQRCEIGRAFDAEFLLERRAAFLGAAEALHDLDGIGCADGAGEHLGPAAEPDDTDFDAIAGHEFLIAASILPRRTRVAKRPADAHAGGPVLQHYAHQPSDFFTRSAVKGECRNLAPDSRAIALPTAGAPSGAAIWPTPLGGLSVRITSTWICGTSFMRGTW